MDQDKFGRFIAKLRKENGYTQEKLGEKLGVTAKSVSKWENGRTLPDISLFPKIATLLGVSISDLFAGECVTNIKKEDIKLINDSTETIIKKSNKKILKKATKLFVGILIIFFIIFGSYIYFSNYYKYDVYTIASENKDYLIHGYLAQYVDNTVLFIESINYKDTSIGTEDEISILSLEVKITSNGKIIESISIDYPNEEYLSNALGNVHFFINLTNNEEEKRKINISDLHMNIKYFSKGKTESVDFKIIDNSN